jgi:hypothetical protein
MASISTIPSNRGDSVSGNEPCRPSCQQVSRNASASANGISRPHNSGITWSVSSPRRKTTILSLTIMSQNQFGTNCELGTLQIYITT